MAEKKHHIRILADCFGPKGAFLKRGSIVNAGASAAQELCNSGRAVYATSAEVEAAKKAPAKKEG